MTSPRLPHLRLDSVALGLVLALVNLVFVLIGFGFRAEWTSQFRQRERTMERRASAILKHSNVQNELVEVETGVSPPASTPAERTRARVEKLRKLMADAHSLDQSLSNAETRATLLRLDNQNAQLAGMFPAGAQSQSADQSAVAIEIGALSLENRQLLKFYDDFQKEDAAWLDDSRVRFARDLYIVSCILALLAFLATRYILLGFSKTIRYFRPINTAVFQIVYLSGAAFLLDVISPRGVAAALPYLAPVLMAITLLRRAAIYWVAGSMSVLAFIGGLLTPAGQAQWVVDINRILGIVAFWVAAFLGVRLIRVGHDLQRSEARLHEAQQIAKIGSWEVNLRTKETIWSPEIYRLLHLDPGVPASLEAFLRPIDPDDRQRIVECINHAEDMHAPSDIQLRVCQPDGETRIMHHRLAAGFDSEGRASSFVGTMQDITERTVAEAKIKASLREKETMLREIHHRVKNNFQVFRSLLYFQAKKVKDAGTRIILDDSQHRVDAMLLVHDLLYQSEDLGRVDFAKYVRKLVDQIERSYGRGNFPFTVKIDVGQNAFPAEVALPCGMMLSELLLNAIKHAYPDGRTGHVAIYVHQFNGRVRMSVSDDGVGLPEKRAYEESSSFGFTLIANLARQLGGTVKFESHGGTLVSAEFPFLLEQE